MNAPSPLITWGSVARGTKTSGTWAFYTKDYRFNRLWSDPRPVVRSGAQAIIEPNLSCTDSTPYAVAVWRTYQKRWLARWWQAHGLKVVVDLNVDRRFSGVNLLGVPSGWLAYATRGSINQQDEIKREYENACNRAGTDGVSLWVYGGSPRLADICHRNGWIHLPETMDLRRDVRRRIEDGQTSRHRDLHGSGRTANRQA